MKAISRLPFAIPLPHVLIVVSLAFGLGAALAYPLLGWKLTDAAAQIVGSAVGAMLTVGGALWLWQVQERGKSRASLVALAATLGGYRGVMAICERTANDPNVGLRDLRESYVFLTKETRALEQRWMRFSNTITGLDAYSIQQYHGVEDAFWYVIGNLGEAGSSLETAASQLRKVVGMTKDRIDKAHNWFSEQRV